MGPLLLLVIAMPCAADAVARLLVVRRDLRGVARWWLAMPLVGAIAVAVHRGLPAKRRVAALLAGPAAAYVVTAGAVAVLALVIGLPSGRAVYAVAGTEPGMPADGVLVAGDRILTLDGAPMDASRDSLAEEVNRRGARAIEVGIERDGAARSVTVTPRRDDQGRFRIGVRPSLEVVRETTGLAASLAAGLRIPLSRVRATAIGYVDVVLGQHDDQVKGRVGLAELVEMDPDSRAGEAVRWAGWTLFQLVLVSIICLAAVSARALRHAVSARST